MHNTQEHRNSPFRCKNIFVQGKCPKIIFTNIIIQHIDRKTGNFCGQQIFTVFVVVVEPRVLIYVQSFKNVAQDKHVHLEGLRDHRIYLVSFSRASISLSAVSSI